MLEKCNGQYSHSQVKTEKGTRSLGQSRISLADNQLSEELGQFLLSCHISVLLTLQSSSWSWKWKRLCVCVRECSGRSCLPFRDMCSSRCTWCTEKSMVMVHFQIFPCGAVLGTLLRKTSVTPLYFHWKSYWNSVLKQNTSMQYLTGGVSSSQDISKTHLIHLAPVLLGDRHEA